MTRTQILICAMLLGCSESVEGEDALEGGTACEKWASLSQAKGCEATRDCDVPAACDAVAQDWLDCAARDLAQCLCEGGEDLNCEGSFKTSEGPALCISEYARVDACLDEQDSGNEHVGDACEPQVVPDTGFEEVEAYLELSSPACGDDACIVYHLAGDPSAGCVPTAEKACASAEDVEERVYCTCLCSGADDADMCECPDGFACTPVIERGASSDSYCVRNTP